MHYTDKDKLFLRAWKRHLPTPRDWSAAQIEEGISSYLDWSEWINSLEELSVSLLDQVLAKFQDSRFPPTLSTVRGLYAQGRGQVAQSQGRKCPHCRGFGFLYVPVMDRSTESNPDWHATLIASHTPVAYKARVNTVACPACPAGHRHGGNGATEYMQKSYLEFALDDLACELFCAECGRLPSPNANPEATAPVPDEDWPSVPQRSQEEPPF